MTRSIAWKEIEMKRNRTRHEMEASEARGMAIIYGILAAMMALVLGFTWPQILITTGIDAPEIYLFPIAMYLFGLWAHQSLRSCPNSQETDGAPFGVHSEPPLRRGCF